MEKVNLNLAAGNLLSTASNGLWTNSSPKTSLLIAQFTSKIFFSTPILMGFWGIDFMCFTINRSEYWLNQSVGHIWSSWFDYLSSNLNVRTRRWFIENRCLFSLCRSSMSWEFLHDFWNLSSTVVGIPPDRQFIAVCSYVNKFPLSQFYPTSIHTGLALAGEIYLEMNTFMGKMCRVNSSGDKFISGLTIAAKISTLFNWTQQMSSVIQKWL